MKKAGKIALCVAGAVVVCCGAAVAWQWNNIKAAGYLLTLDGAALDTRIEENERALDGAMEKYNVQSYSFSPEEVAGLTSGELSADEAAARVLEAADAGTPPAESAAPETEGPAATPPASQQPEEETVSSGGTEEDPYAEENAEIRSLIAKMYVLRATYVGKLEAVVQSAIDEYVAGEHTSENRTRVVYSKFEELTALEAECDQEVAAVVSRLRELLKATGQDDSLARQVEETYEEEKSLKKAYYLKEFQEG